MFKTAKLAYRSKVKFGAKIQIILQNFMLESLDINDVQNYASLAMLIHLAYLV